MSGESTNYKKKQEEMVQYIGSLHPNCDYHHGQIKPARGVKCIQVVRANRHQKDGTDGTDSTYKHAPDLSYFHGKFYLLYLCNPVEEHSGAGYSVLASSEDGMHWEEFQTAFPEYRIKAVTVTDYKGLPHTFDGTTYAFMHQRMGFYRSSSDRMLVLGFYGWSPEKWMTNWDNYGIGRVVRELYPDGSLSDIYFIRPNRQSGFQEKDLNYPLYTKSKDPGFIEACEELLSNSLVVQQWAEENGDMDPLIQIKHPAEGGTYQAFCSYHISESEVVALWKHSLTARSHDGGETWSKVEFSPSLVMSGQKIWGQKTCDGRFALCYDPTLETEHRYPLCVTTSEDGIHFDRMRLIHGQVPRMRYAGFWKDLGPQYMRGIAEGITTREDHPKENAFYMTYSVNKEDIWFSSIPVPVLDEQKTVIQEYPGRAEDFARWNAYLPKWTSAESVRPEKQHQAQQNVLQVIDEEPCDHTVLERVMIPAEQRELELILIPQQVKGALYLNLMDEKAAIAVQIILRENHKIYVRTVTELETGKWNDNERLKISIKADCRTYQYSLKINEEAGKTWRFRAAVNETSRFQIRTGKEEMFPSLDTVPGDLTDLPYEGSEKRGERCAYQLMCFSTEARENERAGR